MLMWKFRMKVVWRLFWCVFYKDLWLLFSFKIQDTVNIRNIKIFTISVPRMYVWIKKMTINFKKSDNLYTLIIWRIKYAHCYLKFTQHLWIQNANTPTNTEYCCNMRIQLDKKDNSYHTKVCWVLKKLDLIRYTRQKKAQLFRTL